MLKVILKVLLVSVLPIATQACAPRSQATLDPNAISTAIVGTIAALTQTSQGVIPITGQESPTATKALSPTPFPTFTLVVFGTPTVRVSVDTNCRTGPGNVYDRVGVLQADEVAVVVGRSADGNYWIIRNPDRPGQFCWIPDENATILTGITGVLPVFASPPTPTATNTRIPTSTSIPSRTPTRTLQPTSTPSRTPTASLTNTSTSTPTSSLTLTLTPSLTSTSTPTPCVTLTSAPSLTPASSLTPTPTSTSTPTSIPCVTLTSTPSRTPTSSFTPTSTSTSTSTPTSSRTPTPTPTLTP